MSKVENKDLLQKVATATSEILDGEGIKIKKEKAAVIIPSIVSNFLEQLTLASSKEAAANEGEFQVDFMNQFTLAITNRASSEGEKDGNVMISLIPGPKLKLAAKNDDASEGEE